MKKSRGRDYFSASKYLPETWNKIVIAFFLKADIMK